MKKMVSIVAIFLVLFLLLFSLNVYADEKLENVNVTVDKETVHPGETVKVNVDFGTDLGAYTVDVTYDSKLLEYVSFEGGTQNNNGSRVRVVFHDDTGGSNPRSSMSVTFRAKEEIITSNPTELKVTATGLAGPSASPNYEDITTPITKTIMVEPSYIDYDIALNYTGDIIKNVEKDMQIVISSSMGRSYEHTRIIAESKTPENETVKLLGTDNQGLEHDIIQSGWGDDAGDSIGGKDVVKELDVRGLFSGAGDYSITLKLVDRDKSDEVIASKTFKIPVKGEENETPTDTTQNNNQVTQNEQEPTSLPKTGNTIYFIILPLIVMFIAVSYFYLNKKD